MSMQRYISVFEESGEALLFQMLVEMPLVHNYVKGDMYYILTQ